MIEAREPERDPELADALRLASLEDDLSDADIERLRRRIRARAEDHAHSPAPDAPLAEHVLPLAPARRRLLRPALALPALLAAALAGILLLRGEIRTPARPASPAAALSAAEAALTADVSDAEFTRLVTGADDPAALLRIAVSAGATAPTP